jgi:hypothetical protein
MHIMHPLGRFDMVFFDFEEIFDMNALDQQHASIFTNLAGGFRAKPSLACGYFARFQRAAKGARQSAGGCGHHIVEGGGGRLEAIRINAVMRSDLRVHPEHYRFFGLRKIGAADGAAQAFDGTMRSVNNVVEHGSSSFILRMGQAFFCRRRAAQTSSLALQEIDPLGIARILRVFGFCLAGIR